jgi:hypothetical protein
MIDIIPQCRQNRSGRPGVRRTNIQLTLSDLQVGCHKKVINLTHARLIAIQSQWDLTRMHKDRFMICNDAAELQVPQEEIWGGERRKVLLFTYYTCCLKCFLPPVPHKVNSQHEMCTMPSVTHLQCIMGIASPLYIN